MEEIDKEVLEQLSHAYQLFYKMCREAGIEIPTKIEEREEEKT